MPSQPPCKQAPSMSPSGTFILKNIKAHLDKLVQVCPDGRLKNASPLFLCGAPQSIPSVAKNCFISCVFIPYLTILCQENMAVFKALFHILIERITLRKFCDHFLCFRFGIRRSIRYNQLDRLSDHFHIRRNQSSGCKGCCSKADSAGNSP